MSIFKFGELRSRVTRLGPSPAKPDHDVYAVSVTLPESNSGIEIKTARPKGDRTSASDFSLAAELIDYMHQAAEDPRLWSIKMNQIGLMSPEELNVTLEMADKLSPYLNEAMLDAAGRMDLYSEYREGRVGPLELGIARVLELPDRIRTPQDIAQFFAYLYLVDKVQFHPDDDFSEYVDEKGEAAYTRDEAFTRDDLMAQARATSEINKFDIYELGLWVGALTGHLPSAETEASAPAWLKALSNTWI